MDRKEFIKTTCTLCIGLQLFPMFEAVAKNKSTYKAVIKNGTLIVPISEFDNKNLLKVRNKSLDYDLLIVKEGENFTCLNMKCSHEGVAVSLNGNRLQCAAHGSTFDLKGNALTEPAIKPLEQFKYLVENDILFVKI